MIEACFGMSARADIQIMIPAAEKVSSDSADQGEEESEYETGGVDYHRTSLSCSADQSNTASTTSSKPETNSARTPRAHDDFSVVVPAFDLSRCRLGFWLFVMLH